MNITIYMYVGGIKNTWYLRNMSIKLNAPSKRHNVHFFINYRKVLCTIIPDLKQYKCCLIMEKKHYLMY